MRGEHFRGAVLLFVAAAGFAGVVSIVSCGSSDDTATDAADGGEPRDAHVVPYDAGYVDAGPDDDSGGDYECLYCSQVYPNGLNPSNPPPCPGTLALYTAIIDCSCNIDDVTGEAGAGLCDLDSGTGDSGTGACTDFCSTDARGLSITNPCLQCGFDKCRLQVLACLNDGADAGDD